VVEKQGIVFVTDVARDLWIYTTLETGLLKARL
jgi:hypothetical protein